MAAMCRTTKTLLFSAKTIVPLYQRSSNSLIHIYAPKGQKASPKSPLPSSIRKEFKKIAKNERLRLEEVLKSKGMQEGSYPQFTVAVTKQKVTDKFQIPPTYHIPPLVANLMSDFGVKVEGSCGTDSEVLWQLILSRPNEEKDVNGIQRQLNDKTGNGEDLHIFMSRSLNCNDGPEIKFIKQGSFSSSKLDALVSLLQLEGENRVCGAFVETNRRKSRAKGDLLKNISIKKSVASLEAMGVKVYGLDKPNLDFTKSDISWDNIAGYNQQKRNIEDAVLLALRRLEVYDDIARGTRCKFETNRPRALLFDGPPGTGKTSCARVIANQAGVPLLYVPLEVYMSKWVGESEKLFGKVFSLANEIPDGAIIFLDEIDSLATSRSNRMRECTRRILSILLQQIDGFEQDRKVIVIGATNRKQDLDPSLNSRFNSVITFGLPDKEIRKDIAAQYAKHLTNQELAEFAEATEGMAGRDIKSVCQKAEWHWASKIIRGQEQRNSEHLALPPIDEYIKSAEHRRESRLSDGAEERR